MRVSMLFVASALTASLAALLLVERRDAAHTAEAPPTSAHQPLPRDARPSRGADEAYATPIAARASRAATTPGERDLTRDFIRASLATTIEAKLPELKLSDIELDDLADATMRLRSAQRALRGLPEDRENAAQRAALHEALSTAIADFSYVTGLAPDAFSARVQSGVGVQSEVEGEVVFRPIRRKDTLP